MNKKELLRSLKFLMFSISAGVIELGTYELLHHVFHLSHPLSYFVGLVLSVLWNFTFNRKYTFKSDANIARAMTLVALYYCAFIPASTYLEHVLTQAGWNGTLVTLLNMVINFVTEFLFQRFVVYRNRVDTAVQAK